VTWDRVGVVLGAYAFGDCGYELGTRTPKERLAEVLRQNAQIHRHVTAAYGVLFHREAEDDSYDRALFFTIDPGHIHVVGLSPLAAQIRLLLSDGFNGWHLYALPRPGPRCTR
jgi:hypothetical protein